MPMGRLLMLKAFFSRPMNILKAPLQKPRVFLSVGRVRGAVRLEVMDMLREICVLEGEREEMEGLVCGICRGVWF